jgi:hypothetical protein
MSIQINEYDFSDFEDNGYAYQQSCSTITFKGLVDKNAFVLQAKLTFDWEMVEDSDGESTYSYINIKSIDSDNLSNIKFTFNEQQIKNLDQVEEYSQIFNSQSFQNALQLLASDLEDDFRDSDYVIDCLYDQDNYQRETQNPYHYYGVSRSDFY